MSTIATPASPEATDACFKCNNCKASFSCVEIIKEHYKSDWHILNSKRRAQNLLPLSKEEFKKIKHTLPQKKPLPKPSAPSSSGAVSNRPASQPTHTPPKPPALGVLSTVGSSSSTAILPPTPPVAADPALVAEVKPAKSNKVSAAEVSEPPSEEPEHVAFEELEVDPLISLFDNARFANVDDCLAHMARNYGFYIPDAEYVVDMPDLLDYLGSKVKQAGLCLFCHRQFRSAYACQNHMKDMGHCKVAYEEDNDVEELEEFYDYFEDEEEGDGDDDEDDDDEEEQEAYVSDIGELVLPDGRTVGHRAFRLYYKQRHRPVDDRPSILAVEREQILSLGGSLFGKGGAKVTNEDLIRMSEGELRGLVMKFQKEQRKGQIVEQRGHMRKMMMDQKREYRSLVDKARSSSTTTAKIRDYHKTVM